VTAREADVIVVGAGAAGAAGAILLAEKGVAVRLLDPVGFPRSMLCGGYLSPEVPRVLDRLGVLKAVDAVATPLAGMRITAPDGTLLDGRYRPIGPWRPYREHALAVPRDALDRALVDRVRALPVDFHERTRVTGVLFERGLVTGVEAVDEEGGRLVLRSRLVIAADGRGSAIEERLGLRSSPALRRTALVACVDGLETTRSVGELFVDPPDYAILTPVAVGRASVCLVVPHSHAAPWSGRLQTFFAARVKQFPHLARRIAGARLVAPVEAPVPLEHETPSPRVGGVMLAGAAAGFFDPFTGEGIYRALRSVELAVETAVGALRGGDCSRPALAAYERARDRAFRGKARLTHVLQLVIGRRRVANGAARVLARRPELLDVLLGVIGDFVPPRAFWRSLVVR